MGFRLEQILNGVFRLTFGTPETMVPSVQSYGKAPLTADIVFTDAPRGCRPSL